MASGAKELRVAPIEARDANRIIRKLHYSGKVVNNSQVHLGVFLGGECGGAMQFGPSLDKRKLQGLVRGTLWNEFIELNRMAFADWLPRNSESRCIGYAMRWLRKTYPWLKWVVSFADATQCGDGTIYRASGFVLSCVRKNTEIWRMPDGKVIHAMTLKSGDGPRNTGGSMSSQRIRKRMGADVVQGFQCRYLYFLDPSARDRLTVPVLPFSEIERLGAGMYRGKPRAKQATGSLQEHSGGAAPTRTLQTSCTK